jgi:hypothetical protein
MSADDVRDLVSEFDHASVSDLEFYRWSPPDFRFGEIVAGTGGYAQIDIGGPFAYVPNPPAIYLDKLSEGDRMRDPRLIWQWSELLDGTPTESLRSINPSTQAKADRVRDVTSGRWYEVSQSEYDYRAVAKVAGVVILLIDGDPAMPAPEDPP